MNIQIGYNNNVNDNFNDFPNMGNFQIVNMNFNDNHNIITIPAIPPDAPLNGNINNNNEGEGEAEEQPQVVPLAAYPRGKRILVSALTCIVFTILSVLMASILPWFEVPKMAEYYSQDQFLWLFLLPPLSAVPLMFSSITLMGRICWLHCWTVTVISIDVPSAVIFVSFGASLVYSGIGTVMWSTGAFLVVLAHVMSIIGGLLFMKLAQILEMGPPPVIEGPPVGPITVSIGMDIEEGENDSAYNSKHYSKGPPKYGSTEYGVPTR